MFCGFIANNTFRLGRHIMSSNIIKSTEEIVSCSDNGQHPLVYINLKSGSGQCQYCSQKFAKISVQTPQKAAA